MQPVNENFQQGTEGISCEHVYYRSLADGYRYIYVPPAMLANREALRNGAGKEHLIEIIQRQDPLPGGSTYVNPLAYLLNNIQQTGDNRIRFHACSPSPRMSPLICDSTIPQGVKLLKAHSDVMCFMTAYAIYYTGCAYFELSSESSDQGSVAITRMQLEGATDYALRLVERLGIDAENSKSIVKHAQDSFGTFYATLSELVQGIAGMKQTLDQKNQEMRQKEEENAQLERKMAESKESHEKEISELRAAMAEKEARIKELQEKIEAHSQGDNEEGAMETEGEDTEGEGEDTEADTSRLQEELNSKEKELEGFKDAVRLAFLETFEKIANGEEKFEILPRLGPYCFDDPSRQRINESFDKLKNQAQLTRSLVSFIKKPLEFEIDNGLSQKYSTITEEMTNIKNSFTLRGDIMEFIYHLLDLLPMNPSSDMVKLHNLITNFKIQCTEKKFSLNTKTLKEKIGAYGQRLQQQQPPDVQDLQQEITKITETIQELKESVKVGSDFDSPTTIIPPFKGGNTQSVLEELAENIQELKVARGLATDVCSQIQDRKGPLLNLLTALVGNGNYVEARKTVSTEFEQGANIGKYLREVVDRRTGHAEDFEKMGLPEEFDLTSELQQTLCSLLACMKAEVAAAARRREDVQKLGAFLSGARESLAGRKDPPAETRMESGELAGLNNAIGALLQTVKLAPKAADFTGLVHSLQAFATEFEKTRTLVGDVFQAGRNSKAPVQVSATNREKIKTQIETEGGSLASLLHMATANNPRKGTTEGGGAASRTTHPSGRGTGHGRR